MVIGNPLKPSPGFPPPHTVREGFPSYGVPSRINPRLGPFAPTAFTILITTMDPLTAHRYHRDLPPSTDGLSNVPSHLSLTMNTTGPHCTDEREQGSIDPSPCSVPSLCEKELHPHPQRERSNSTASNVGSSPGHSALSGNPAPHTAVTTLPGFTPPGERTGTHAGGSGTHHKVDRCGPESHRPIR